MSMFKKQVNFVSAICPECRGHLELDSNLETAFCQYCGTQCIVENAPKKEKKQGKLETVLDFYERQQALRRQDKRERQRQIDEEERIRQEHLRKYRWVYILIGITLFGFIFTMAILEHQGVV